MSIAIVTGPSSGLGRATAIELGRRDFHVVCAGRSEQKTTPVVAAIEAEGGSAEFLHLDLASLESVEEAARRFNASGRAVDVLVNNAGVGGVTGLTEDGFEIHFGVNHLGHFMLTEHLRPTFRPGTRVVVVSSEVHRRADGIDFAAVRKPSGLTRSLARYGVSKLANILFARRLAQLEPDLNTYSLHPGVVDTGIFPSYAKFLFRGRVTPEVGARTSVWCATSPDVADDTGLYYSRMKVWEPSAVALDDDLAEELWSRSEDWCDTSAAT